jgi:amino acid permease
MSFQSSQDLQGANLTKLICYLIVGAMLLLTIQALGELAVVYPENGAFFTYCVRFINPAWLVVSRSRLLSCPLATLC